MATMLSPSISGVPLVTKGGSSGRNKLLTKNHHASISGSSKTTLSHKSGIIQKEQYVMWSSLQQNFKHNLKVIKRGSKSKEFEKKYTVNAAPKQSFEYVDEPKDSWVSLKQSLDILYRFCRPYAIFGAVVGATFFTLLPVEKISDLSPTFFIGGLQVVIASIFMSIFNAGLNQFYDVEIDKINKPYLPLASGEMPYRNGVIIVSSSLILGFLLAWAVGSWPLFWTNLMSAVIAAAYSADLPFLRWKKSSVLTSLNFIIDGALTRPIGFFLHMQTCVLKRPATFPRQLIFCTVILSVFSVAVALLKDIPDVKGDEKSGIKSLSSTWGRKQVFWFCISLLEMAYGVAIIMGTRSVFLWSKIITVLAHAILASALWYQTKFVDFNDNASLQSFYSGFFWKLLTAEYILIPFFR